MSEQLRWSAGRAVHAAASASPCQARKLKRNDKLNTTTLYKECAERTKHIPNARKQMRCQKDGSLMGTHAKKVRASNLCIRSLRGLPQAQFLGLWRTSPSTAVPLDRSGCSSQHVHVLLQTWHLQATFLNSCALAAPKSAGV